MTRLSLSVGAVFGLVAVGLGAFGAHGLKDRVAAELLDTWTTAADYLALHALALLALGLLSAQRPDSKLLPLAALCFMVGALVFSGSLFVLVLTDMRAWGAVTPVGGTLLIAGWTVLAIAVWRAYPPAR